MDAVPRTANLRQSLDHAGYYPELVGDVLDVAYQLGVVAGVIEALAQVRCSWHGVHPSIRLRLPPRVPGPGVGHAADPASGGKGPSRGVGPTGLGQLDPRGQDDRAARGHHDRVQLEGPQLG